MKQSMGDRRFADIESLIVVPGHAVYVAEDFQDPAADESWHLEEFQRGEPPLYIAHIRRGVELARLDDRSLLVFSGGQTVVEAGPRSEALVYWLIARHFGWWDAVEVERRAVTEEFARDSFENLLLGICRFHECTGGYPRSVTVVGWAFKERRFQLHRDAIRFPIERFDYFGEADPEDLKKAIEGELRNAVEPFESDPYGTGRSARGAILKEKRRTRNPFNRTHPYETSCPDLAGLLRHKGPGLFDGKLPW